MNINLVCPIMVLDNETNPNIRKNDIKTLKLLVSKNSYNLVSIKLNEPQDIKRVLRDKIKSIISNDIFHLEQVYTLGEEKYYTNNSVDIIYLAIMNKEDIKKLDEEYTLIDFAVKNNTITFSNNTYAYHTEEKIDNNNIEYYHKINVSGKYIEKKLLEILIAYKHLRVRIDFSDIMFKFMGSTFTLEDVRGVYELIKETSVDKSNFRKKIIKYCEEVSMESSKKGYRPSKIYKFKVTKGDTWV